MKNEIAMFLKYFNSVQNNANEKIKDSRIFNPLFFNALIKNNYINKDDTSFRGYQFTVDKSRGADYWGMYLEPIK